MRIIHLSDLHINPKFYKINIYKIEHVLLKAIEVGFDHLVVTGDISHDADKESLMIFKEILKKHGLLDSSKCTVIIGNHDIFGGVYTVKELFNFPERCKSTNYDDKIVQFLNVFEELFVDCVFASKDKIFPFAKVIGEYAFFGLNTNDVYSKIKNPFASNGKIYKHDFTDLEKLLKLPSFDNKTKILLAHHHFSKKNIEVKSSNYDLWNKIEGYTLKLRGKKSLINLFKRNDVKLVLHGHNHENSKYERRGITFYNSGASIDNNKINEAEMRIIEISENSIKSRAINIKLDLELELLQIN